MKPRSEPPNVTLLEDPFVLPERAFFQRLEERARRVDLLTALVRAGGIGAEPASRALQAALSAIETSASRAQLESLAALATSLSSAIGAVVNSIPNEAHHVADVLVIDETEVSRDLVALAVEVQGHTVRCASNNADFISQFDERKPDLIITDVELSNAPPRQFCGVLRELVSGTDVKIALFSSVAPDLLAELEKIAGAACVIRKDEGIDKLIARLAPVFVAMREHSSTGRPPSL